MSFILDYRVLLSVAFVIRYEEFKYWKIGIFQIFQMFDDLPWPYLTSNCLWKYDTLTHSLPDAKRNFSLDIILSLKITGKILRKLVPLRTISDAYAFLWANLDMNVIF